jgi:hypothetical protein
MLVIYLWKGKGRRAPQRRGNVIIYSAFSAAWAGHGLLTWGQATPPSQLLGLFGTQFRRCCWVDIAGNVAESWGQ